ncbi:L,D-transpeptidase family protein [Novosphingobium sp. RD2P27]|uniref:L,D-transpeptidase family protein n=1 Tax=Novosphingobium kalidii TaxID=3230299 RepID=A0ABV2D151_9SPHN
MLRRIAVLGLPLLAGLALALVLLTSPSGEPQAPRIKRAEPSGTRINYPVGQYPVLRLPDGERRVVHSLLNTAAPHAYGEYVWDDSGVPPGQVWIRVDLALQTISVFRAGHEIGSALILYGAKSKPTPPGVYPVLAKAEQHRSSLYDAEMPYMLRLTGDGIAIHASDVRPSAATHGCIGVPLQFARLLFAQVEPGDRVAIIAARQPPSSI